MRARTAHTAKEMCLPWLEQSDRGLSEHDHRGEVIALRSASHEAVQEIGCCISRRTKWEAHKDRKL